MPPSVSTTRARIALVLLCGLATASATAQSLSSSGVRAVPTYEAVGLYWSAPGAGSAGCDVRYRRSGASAWSQGLALWFDAASNECRGSLVNLAPGTAYEVQLGVSGAYTRGTTFATWPNQVPIATTIAVPSGSGTLNVSAGGSAAGYVLYDGTGSVLDAANGAQYNVTINASYVIVRGFTLRGAQIDAIRIAPTVHDVIIEDNDISGWGRTRDGKWGADMDSGIRAICKSEELTRVTIQRNRIHDPRYPANSWTDGHPAGPQGITFSYCGGNHVLRWNEIYSAKNHFNDAMGGEDNFSNTGFPNADSDIYGNRIEMAWDDGIESEGGNRNVRIWGNYLDRTATGIASTVDSVGPLYIFRNVWNRNQFMEGAACDSDQKQPMFKSGSSADFANGRRYLFHNTMLQAQQSGCQYGLGGGAGIGGTGDSQLVRNTVSMNNIYHLWKPNGAFYQVGSDVTFQNDLTNAVSTPEVGGIVATPVYASGNGWQSGSGGLYQLAAGSPGYDAGLRIPNFNDHFNGTAPDVGAAEAGDTAMKFGVAASSGNSGAATVPTTLPAGPTPDPTPSPSSGTSAGSGSASTSLGIDASSYAFAAGEAVTFTVTVAGASGTPTGTIAFRADGASIAGCEAAALSGGRAACTTSALGGGNRAITGDYSGDASYAAGRAGPITVAVSGTSTSLALPARFGMDSSSYTVGAGQSVKFTATVPGDGGSLRFEDNGHAIGGCDAAAVVAGRASLHHERARRRQPRDPRRLLRQRQLRRRDRRTDHADRHRGHRLRRAQRAGPVVGIEPRIRLGPEPRAAGRYRLRHVVHLRRAGQRAVAGDVRRAPYGDRHVRRHALSHHGPGLRRPVRPVPRERHARGLRVARLQRRRPRYVHGDARRAHREQGHHAPGVERGGPGVQRRHRRHAERELPGPLVAHRRRGVGLGTQRRAPGRYPLRHLVHLRCRGQGHVAGGLRRREDGGRDLQRHALPHDGSGVRRAGLGSVAGPGHGGGDGHTLLQRPGQRRLQLQRGRRRAVEADHARGLLVAEDDLPLAGAGAPRGAQGRAHIAVPSTTQPRRAMSRIVESLVL